LELQGLGSIIVRVCSGIYVQDEVKVRHCQNGRPRAPTAKMAGAANLVPNSSIANLMPKKIFFIYDFF
jgi:hypothetical protein